LVTPTIHPWYVLWPLVLAPLAPSAAVLAWSATVPLAYHFSHALGARPPEPDPAWGLRWLEMAPVWVGGIADLFARVRSPARLATSAPALPHTAAATAWPPAARVALLVPALDEEPSLPSVLADLEPLRRDRPGGAAGGFLDEIIVVDNGSRD